MTDKSPSQGAEELTFEEAFGRLEEAVQALEAGGLTLANATRLYEEGMRLARSCNELLSATEMRVTRLQTSFGEQMRFLTGADGGKGGRGPAMPPGDAPEPSHDGEGPP